jgi:hypothetical protein
VKKLWLGFCFMVIPFQASAQMPPMFFGGPPGFAQFQAITLQRHQARTLLYRDAIEELKKNPQAADIPVCAPNVRPRAGECLLPAAESSAVPTEPTLMVRRLALLIGNNNYPSPIPPLDTPVADVTQIGKLLETRYGYRNQVLKNAGKEAIIAAMNQLAQEARKEDSVLVLYAGHGYQMDDSRMGYWIPIDGSVKSAKGWISNDDIARLLAAIPARQIILVSDSCFSGTLAKEKKLRQSGRIEPEKILHRRSVMVMTSGDEEPVSDEGKEGHSIFAWNLLRSLETARALMPGYEVWQSVHQGVTKDYPQIPQYGAVMSAGHVDGGEYLFHAETR